MIYWSSYAFVIPFIPHKIASHWAFWMVVQQYKLSLYFMSFKIPPKDGRSITLETDTTSLDGPSCMCGTFCDGVIMLLLFYGETLGSWLGVYLGSSSRSGVNQVSLGSILPGAPLCEMHFTRSVQFGVIVTSLMNGTVENSSSNTTHNWGETWLVSGFRTRATDTPWNGEWQRYILEYERGSHLDSPAMLPCNIESKA